MFTEYAEKQYTSYNEAVIYYKDNPQKLIEVEKFVMNEILHFIDIHQPEIKADYDEASYNNIHYYYALISCNKSI